VPYWNTPEEVYNLSVTDISNANTGCTQTYVQFIDGEILTVVNKDDGGGIIAYQGS